MLKWVIWTDLITLILIIKAWFLKGNTLKKVLSVWATCIKIRPITIKALGSLMKTSLTWLNILIFQSLLTFWTWGIHLFLKYLNIQVINLIQSVKNYKMLWLKKEKGDCKLKPKYQKSIENSNSLSKMWEWIRWDKY